MNRTRASGFTLIEMMVVVAIIAILATLLLPALLGTSNTRKRLLAHETVRAIHAAATMYYDNFGVYPPDSADFDTGDNKEQYFDKKSIYRYLGRKLEDKTTGKWYGPFLNIKPQFLIDEEYMDPWGKPYQMDALHVRVIIEKGPREGDVERMGSPYPAGTLQEKQTLEVKVWSGGTDQKWAKGSNVELGKGTDLDDQDNVTTWAD